jgi:hypothetical protein
MIDYDKVPWRAVQEYLLSIESAPTMDEFFSRALSEVDRLIPSDVGVGIFDNSGRMISSNGFRDAEARAYNDYYLFRIPFIPDPQRIKEISLSLVGDNHCSIIKWSDYRDSEFVTDFVQPQGNAYNLACSMPEL